jgi:electron transfer flavoprotein alpha subunit
VTFVILPLYYCRASENLYADIVISSKLCLSEQKGRIHMKSLRIAALVKQIPRFEEIQLGPDGRLKRDGVELAMNPYCLRAVSKGVELAQKTGGSCTVISLGPPAAEDVVRWGVVGGAERGILITDPAFAGSDTLATARALAAAVTKEGPFDLILVGKNSVDADTGQVGPELAQLLGYPFASAVRTLELVDDMLHLGCEYDDAWAEVEISLPAVLATAERLCAPARAEPEERAAVAPEKLVRLGAADLGAGPWGQAGSPTWVGETRLLELNRARQMLQGSLPEQIAQAVSIIKARGALATTTQTASQSVAPAATHPAATVAVLLEPERPGSARELLGAASQLAARIAARVVAIQPETAHAQTPEDLSAWGADHIVVIQRAAVAEDVAQCVAEWSSTHRPWSILAPSTTWGREVASRIAAQLGAGLTGDAIQLEVNDNRLVSWKPAFGGRLVAAIRATSAMQMVTVRPGVLPRLTPRAPARPSVEVLTATSRDRIRLVSRQQNDQLDALALATRVVGVGVGVPPDHYEELTPLLRVLNAELATTRKVTDQNWLPHSRQVGITGRSIAPHLYVALGISGRFNHICGIQAAGTILAINSDAKAPIFAEADIGIVADWAACVPLLVKAFEAA